MNSLMRSICYCCFSLLMVISLKAQNLIPNPSFESITISDCPTTPDNQLPLVPPWYHASEGVDLFVDNCSPDYIVFMANRPSQAINGSNFAGSWAAIYGGAFANGDALGVELTEPLEEKLYYFSAQITNRGTSNPSNPGNYCGTVPARQIGLYVSEDSIYTVEVLDPNGGGLLNTYLEGDLVWADSSMNVQITEPVNGWFEIAGCFRARGGERHIAIAPLFGQVEYAAGCSFTDEFTNFQSYYHDFDQLSLTLLPASVNARATVCKEEGTLVNVFDQITDPRLRRNSEIRWPDGTIANEQIVQEEGILNLELLLACGSIPIFLEVTAVACETQVYVPNAFSPNFDGINDSFGPYIEAVGGIQDYQFQIFNRWGQLVFETNDPNQFWDGRHKFKAAMQGVYVWRLEFLIMEEFVTTEIKESGSLMLVR